MAEQTEGGRAAPRVIVAQKVIDKIVRGALLYPEPETGEAMIGFLVTQSGRYEPDIYVLDTISPGEHAVREWGMFEQGDDWQGDVFHWLYINWESFRAMRRGSYGNALAGKWDVPLAHVGDWHKQPGDMIAPSGGDAQTARNMLEDRETPIEHLITPIVTMYPLPAPRAEDEPAAEDAPAGEPPAEETVPESDELGEMVARTGAAPLPEAEPEKSDAPAEAGAPPEEAAPVEDTSEDTAKDAAGEPGAEPPKDALPVPPAHEPAEEPSQVPAPESLMPPEGPNTIVVPDEANGWLIRMDFWYMSKRGKRFAPVVPAIWPDERLPGLPALAWHLAQPRRFAQEFDLLTDAGYTVDVVRWDADGKPPYEICFSVYKPGNMHVVLMVTSADYPAEMPAARIAPLVSVADDEDVFEKLYEASRPVPMTQMPDWEWDSKRTLVEIVWHVEKVLKKDKA